MPDNFLTPSPGGGLQIQNQQLLERMSPLEAFIKNMKAEIIALKKENSDLKKEVFMPVDNVLNANQVLYETDEEDLGKETNWIRQKRNSKKRKAESSPEIS